MNMTGSVTGTILGQMMPRFLLLYCLPPLAAIAVGLLIFFLGRRHVRRKYGKR